MRPLTPVVALAALTLTACGREELLHGLPEAEANRAIAALEERGLAATKRREEGGDGAWLLEVPRGDGREGRRALAELGLPREPAPGFGEVFGKGSLVPSASEERALYLQALAGELTRTLEALDGVRAARVHLALPLPDPLRPDAPPARAAVLLRTRPGGRAAVEGLAPGLRALVAGAVAGLPPAEVTVLVTEEPPAPSRRAAAGARLRWPLLGGGLLSLIASIALAWPLARERLAARGVPMVQGRGA